MLTDLLHHVTNPWKPREAILRRQWRALQRTLEHAYRNVPFYRERFDRAGLKPADIRQTSDLLRIPPLSKTELRRAGLGLIAQGLTPGRLKSSTTSGSTGQPTDAYFTLADHLRLRYLLKFRSKWICGLRFRHRILLVSSHPVEAVQAENRKPINRLLRKKAVSINESLDRHLAVCRAHRADVIYGTISYFNELKDHLARHPIDWFKPKLLFSSGEMFAPETKHAIMRAFRCPVYDIYGSTELKEVAWECPCGAYHINEDAYLVEFVDRGRHAGANAEGQIIITALLSRGMPLIRYDLEDRGIRIGGRCSQGVRFAMMRPLTGRLVDYFLLPDGKKVAPFTLIVALHDHAAHSIAQFQIVQKATGQVLVRIRPRKNFTAQTAADIVRIYQGLLGKTVKVDIELVRSIEREKSGKYRLVKSECNPIPPKALN